MEWRTLLSWLLKKGKRKATNAHFPVFRLKGPSWLDSLAGSWLSLMAAGVAVLMMPIVVGVLMDVHRGFMAVLMAVAMFLGIQHITQNICRRHASN